MALQLMLFLLQIVFDFLRYILEKRFELFLTAIKMDVDHVTKPVKTVSNFFKKLSGEEIQEEPTPTKTQAKAQALLTKRVQLAKEEKARLREEKQLEKAAAREQKRLDQQALRAQKKQKNVPTPESADTQAQAEPVAEVAATAETPTEKKKKGFFRRK